MALALALPVSLVTIAILVTAVLLATLACALDTLWLTDRAPSWKIMLASWSALLILGWLVGGPFTSYYKTHYLRAFFIASTSMEPTLAKGDFVLTNNSAYRTDGPRRGDIIVFKYPLDERREFVKRVVGLPGDRLEIRSNRLIVNGNPLEEAYVKPSVASTFQGGPLTSCGYAHGCDPTVVPADSYFVLGDNREHSQDSRYWGFVRRDKIVGRAFAIYWSWDPELERPRVDRVGKDL